MVEENVGYKVELVIKIGEREYILDMQEFDTTTGKEIKGIRNEEEYKMIQPSGNYIVLNDLDFSKVSLNEFGFGGYAQNISFKGNLDYNGKMVTITTMNETTLFWKIDKSGKIENLVLDIEFPNTIISKWGEGNVFSDNYGTIENIQINLTQSSLWQNGYSTLIGWENYGNISNFIVTFY